MTTRGHDLVTHDPNGRSCDFAQHHRECDIFCVAMTDVMQGAGAYADPPVTQFDFVLNVDTPPQPVEVGDARFARHNGPGRVIAHLPHRDARYLLRGLDGDAFTRCAMNAFTRNHRLQNIFLAE